MLKKIKDKWSNKSNITKASIFVFIADIAICAAFENYFWKALCNAWKNGK